MWWKLFFKSNFYEINIKIIKGWSSGIWLKHCHFIFLSYSCIKSRNRKEFYGEMTVFNSLLSLLSLYAPWRKLEFCGIILYTCWVLECKQCNNLRFNKIPSLCEPLVCISLGISFFWELWQRSSWWARIQHKNILFSWWAKVGSDQTSKSCHNCNCRR